MRDGTLYKGEFQDGLKKEGTLITASGDEYTGGFDLESRYEGIAVLKRKDGTVYKGEFCRGQATQAYVLHPDGQEYTGELLDFQMHGYGSLKLKNGTHYRGDFKHGQKHGKGILTLPSGSVLQALFKEDLVDIGKFTTEKGTY